VVLGFTVGIALTIISTQFGALLGLEPSRLEGEPIPRWISYFEAWDTADLATAVVGIGAVAAIVAMRRWAPKLPAFLIAVTAASAAVALLKLSADTIGSVYGATAAAPPSLKLPEISLARLQELLPSAFTIAFLAGVESLR
jgi:SulP family sulfate permease